eukprot:Hpha_TRINITY_DN15142_c4_g2::TRINITY_DN15142_c4_g2_i3::g.129863::m.129863
MFRRCVSRLPSFKPSTAENFTDVYERYRHENPNNPIDPWEVRLGTAGVAVTEKKGLGIIHDPLLNKGTAFTPSERDRLMLRGLLPPKLLTIDDQIKRLNKRFHELTDPMDKYEFCTRVLDRNEILFYNWVMQNIVSLAPVIYTPTVGEACLRFGDNYTRPRGMYFSSKDKGEMLSMLYNWPTSEVDVIVVTDGGRVLGLGDLGANGMGIPIGKLALYVAIGGIHPGRVLPVMLDVGTNNEELRNSDTYLGMNHKRLEGDDYNELVDEFMRAVKRRWPRCLVQFEDFSSSQAMPLLDAYRRRVCAFNDDIQGTGAVVLAALFNAIRLQGRPLRALAQMKTVICGAGSAGTGITLQIAEGMEREGGTHKQVNALINLVDKDGLIDDSRASEVDPKLRRFCAGKKSIPGGLYEVIDNLQPNALLGVTGVGGLWDEKVIRKMADINQKPIIFPLSNPTKCAEVSAENCYNWTDGRAIFASGSPFDPVTMPDGRVLRPTQSNNMYIFPGMGLGAVLARSSRITDEMFYASARALALTVQQSELMETGMLFPDIAQARDISAHVATAVITEAKKCGISDDPRTPAEPSVDWVRRMMFVPAYGSVVSPLIQQTFARAASWGASGGAEGVDSMRSLACVHDSLRAVRY